jgi:putative 4-mercaptohistidine N1-methyltranferase
MPAGLTTGSSCTRTMENPYESLRLLEEYLLFHYGEEDAQMPWSQGPREALGFPVRSVTHLWDETSLPAETGRALDVGCAVGRSSFVLAGKFAEVIGIDFSLLFAVTAKKLAAGETVESERLEEGHLRTPCRYRIDPPPQGRLTFEQGDAQNLRKDLGCFDLVHAANLLCRLPEPVLFLKQLPALVKSGGQLLITTPCTWLADYTPLENWPPGKTLDWVKKELSPHFQLEQTTDLPFLIREHARKFQWTMALGMRFRRR